MKHRVRIGLLSTKDNPLPGYILRELINHSLKVDAVIMDAKGISEKDKRIIELLKGMDAVTEARDESAVEQYILEESFGTIL